VSLEPCEGLCGLCAELDFCLATVLCGLSCKATELGAELCELVAVHHISHGEVSDYIGEAGACGLGDKLCDNALFGLAFATVAAHKARFAGLDGHMVLGDVATLVKGYIIVGSYLTREGICKGLLGMLTVIGVGTLDGGKGDSSHFVFLSFVSGCSLSQPCAYIIAYPSGFVKGFLQKKVAQIFGADFVHLAEPGQAVK